MDSIAILFGAQGALENLFDHIEITLGPREVPLKNCMKQLVR